MNIIKISIFTFVLSIVNISCTDSVETTETENTIEAIEKVEALTIAKNVNAEEFKSLIESGKGLLLDVRTADEVSDGAIEGHTNIDFYSAAFSSELDKLNKDVAVYVYCRSGGRSGKAMQQMKDLGFKEVYNLNGGYGNWPFK